MMEDTAPPRGGGRFDLGCGGLRGLDGDFLKRFPPHGPRQDCRGGCAASHGGHGRQRTDDDRQMRRQARDVQPGGVHRTAGAFSQGQICHTRCRLRLVGMARAGGVLRSPRPAAAARTALLGRAAAAAVARAGEAQCGDRGRCRRGREAFQEDRHPRRRRQQVPAGQAPDERAPPKASDALRTRRRAKTGWSCRCTRRRAHWNPASGGCSCIAG